MANLPAGGLVAELVAGYALRSGGLTAHVPAQRPQALLCLRRAGVITGLESVEQGICFDARSNLNRNVAGLFHVPMLHEACDYRRSS
jgi:hypothetical protein